MNLNECDRKKVYSFVLRSQYAIVDELHESCDLITLIRSHSAWNDPFFLFYCTHSFKCP